MPNWAKGKKRGRGLAFSLLLPLHFSQLAYRPKSERLKGHFSDCSQSEEGTPKWIRFLIKPLKLKKKSLNLALLNLRKLAAAPTG